MMASERTSTLTTVGAALAAGLMFLAGASLGGLALAAPAGASPTLTPSSLSALAFGLVLVASGVEGLRRRHFLFAIVIPALMALGCLGYVVATGQWAALPGAAMYLLVVVFVWSERTAFRD
jgi:hypothetical protein